jgi:hypothetical protein
MSVYDNELHHFGFSAIPAAQVRGKPFTVTITAQSVSNTNVPNFTGTVNLSATGDAGAILITPAMSPAFVSGQWTGSVTAGTFSNNIMLTATDGAGHSGTSGAFHAGVGPLHRFSWSPIGATQTVGQPFTSTITALDAGNNPVNVSPGYVLISALPGERTIGTGTATTSDFPLYSYYHDERTQVIYLASEVGGAASLSSLSLYVTTLPGQTLNNWTLRMKHTALSSQTSWDSTGWTTVHQSNRTISQTGWVTFNFTSPFVYNGTNNLLVDFSFNNSSYTSGGAVRAYTGASGRSLYSYTDSGYGDPLTWSGTSPYPNSSGTIPQIKLKAGAVGVVSGPAAVLFTGSTWTGSLWTTAPTAATALVATDFDGVAGTSNSFAVQAALDTDGDGLPDPWEIARGLSPTSAAGSQGALGDPDGDGIPNIFEYAFNLNPIAGDTAGWPTVRRKVNPSDGAEYLEFTCRRRIGSVGITYAIETSNDCTAWSSDPANYQQVGLATPIGDGVTETATFRILPAISPGSPKRFVRLRVGNQ